MENRFTLGIQAKKKKRLKITKTATFLSDGNDQKIQRMMKCQTFVVSSGPIFQHPYLFDCAVFFEGFPKTIFCDAFVMHDKQSWIRWVILPRFRRIMRISIAVRAPDRHFQQVLPRSESRTMATMAEPNMQTWQQEIDNSHNSNFVFEESFLRMSRIWVASPMPSRAAPESSQRHTTDGAAWRSLKGGLFEVRICPCILLFVSKVSQARLLRSWTTAKRPWALSYALMKPQMKFLFVALLGVYPEAQQIGQCAIIYRGLVFTLPLDAAPSHSKS